MEVTGALASPWASSILSFDILLEGCDSDVVTKPTQSNMTFLVDDVLDNFQVDIFLESFGVCGDFTYSATLSNGDPLPDIVTFDVGSRTFTVDTASIMATVTYEIKFIGTMPSPGPIDFITFNLILIGCDSSIISTPAILS